MLRINGSSESTLRELQANDNEVIKVNGGDRNLSKSQKSKNAKFAI